MITSSRFYVGGVPCEFVPGQVTRIGYMRGTEPNRFTLRCSADRETDLAIASKSNPVTVAVIAADETSEGETEVALGNWYILSRKVVERGWVIFELADCRWRQNFEKLTAQYNIVSYQGLYRKDSLNGGQPWKVIDAVRDALQRLGFRVDTSSLPAEALGAVLPDNLGNSEGGGWFAAELAEFIPVMLRTVRCDIVPRTNGKLAIVDRASDANGDLRRYIHLTGDISGSDIHWQKPSVAEVHFEQRIERRLEKTLQASADTLTTAEVALDDPHTPEITNVIPNVTTEMIGNDAGPSPESEQGVRDTNDPASIPLVPYGPYVESFFGDHVVQNRWFKKAFIDADVLDARAVALGIEPGAFSSFWETVEHNIRQCRWQRWKIATAQDGQAVKVIADELRSRYCQIEFGRLQADGTVKADGVYANYISILRTGSLKRKDDDFLTAKFSRNIPFSASIKSPFVAEWLAGHREDLVFQITFKHPPFNRSGFELGTLVSDMGFTSSINDLDEDGEHTGVKKLHLEPFATLDGNLKIQIYMSGLYVGSDQRTHVEKVKMFDGGDVSRVVIRADDMTANYGYNGGTPDWRGRLLNGDELEARAKELVKDVMLTFEDGRVGYLRCGGVDVIAKGGAEVKGDLYSVEIVIGGRAPASIDTHIVYHAAARSVSPGGVTTPGPGGKKSSGKKPRNII